MSAILVVDDSLTVRMDLVEALDTAGFRSVACANLAEARRSRSRLGRKPCGAYPS